MEIPIFGTSSFFVARILRMALKCPRSPKFSLLTLTFIIKTDLRVRNCLFWHVYGSTSCLKIVDNVTRTIFVAAIRDHDWQPSWIFRTFCKSKLFLIYLLKFPSLRNIYSEVHIVNQRKLKAEFLKYYFWLFAVFSWPTFWKWHPGGHVSLNCHW